MPAENPTPNRLGRVLAATRPVQKRSVSAPVVPAKKPQAELKIRRAIFTDAVNIYKALVADEQSRRVRTNNDDLARTAFILKTIAEGFVLVVEASGRIFGVIGMAAGGPDYAKKTTLQAVFSFIAPNFRKPQVVSRLVGMINEFADEHKVDVEIVVGQEVAPYWTDLDFETAGVKLVRPYAEQREEAIDEDEEDEDEFGDLSGEDDAANPVHGTRRPKVSDDLGSELDDDGSDDLSA